MSRRMMIVGNWKMNTTFGDAQELVAGVLDRVGASDARDVVIAPPYPYLHPIAKQLEGSSIALGAQELYSEPSGAKTGAVSGPMLRSVGCRYVIVAHSERRQFFGETDESANLRVHAAFAADLVPVLCVGETLEEREADDTMAVVARQVEVGVEGLDDTQLSTMLLAYEPVWAIGTGHVATPEQAQEVHHMIRERLRERSGVAADSIRIVYGGSVKPENAHELFAQKDVDGGLVGGCSLRPDDFAAIVNT